jgi:hypothetical protein
MQERVLLRAVSSSGRFFSRAKRGNHEKGNRCSCWCSAGVQHSGRRMGTKRRTRRSGRRCCRHGCDWKLIWWLCWRAWLSQSPSPNLNSSSPSTVPQSNETPVTPGTSPGNGTHCSRSVESRPSIGPMGGTTAHISLPFSPGVLEGRGGSATLLSVRFCFVPFECRLLSNVGFD